MIRKKQSSLKSNLIILGSLFLFFVLTTVIIILVFKEDTPIWKVIATSAITVFGSCFFMLSKKKKGYLYNKYQNREYEFQPEKLSLSTIIEKLNIEGFQNIIEAGRTVAFKSKTDKFTLVLSEENTLTIKTKPRFWLQMIDEGALFEQLNLIEQTIFSEPLE